MKPEERIDLIKQIEGFLVGIEGRDVSITELISFDHEKRGFDRHCTVVSCFDFYVDSVSWQISGGHIYLAGPSSRYGFSTVCVSSVAKSGDEMSVTEKYALNAARKTIITLKTDYKR